jgi:hypothetical protein
MISKTLGAIDPSKHFRVLCLLEEQLSLKQRRLEQKLFTSLWGVNYYINAFIQVGNMKAINFKKSADKYDCPRLLTHKYMVEK